MASQPLRDPITQKITDFAHDPENIMHVYAMLKVGRDKGDSPDMVMAKTLISILLKYERIPVSSGHN